MILCEPLDLIIEPTAMDNIVKYISGKYLYETLIAGEDKINIRFNNVDITIDYNNLLEFISNNIDNYTKFGYCLYDLIDAYLVTTLVLCIDQLDTSGYNLN